MLMNIQFMGKPRHKTTVCVIRDVKVRPGGMARCDQCKNRSHSLPKSMQIDEDSSFSTLEFASRPGKHYNSAMHPLAFCHLFGE
jgi:hypothetical protein